MPYSHAGKHLSLPTLKKTNSSNPGKLTYDELTSNSPSALKSQCGKLNEATNTIWGAMSLNGFLARCSAARNIRTKRAICTYIFEAILKLAHCSGYSTTSHNSKWFHRPWIPTPGNNWIGAFQQLAATTRRQTSAVHQPVLKFPYRWEIPISHARYHLQGWATPCLFMQSHRQPTRKLSTVLTSAK